MQCDHLEQIPGWWAVDVRPKDDPWSPPSDDAETIIFAGESATHAMASVQLVLDTCHDDRRAWRARPIYQLILPLAEEDHSR